MSTTAIIAELLVVGFLVTTTILFIVLSALQVDNFSFLIQTKDYSNSIAIIVTIVSYFLGALHTQLTYSTYPLLVIFLQLVFRVKPLKLLLKNKKLNEFIRDRQSYVKGDTSSQQNHLFILEYGTGNTVERIKYLYSLSRLFNTSSTIIPFLGVSLATWLICSFSNWRAACVSIITCFAMTLLTIFSAIVANASYYRETRIAYEIIQMKINSNKG